MATKSSTKRTRNYACIVYPESAPAEWKDILAGSLVDCLVSPLHEFDVNADGSPKKPHYHVIILFDGPKTPEQAREVFDLIGGVGCEVVTNIRNYARYLCHLDNPEKAQYPVETVLRFGNVDYMALIGSPSDKYLAIREMLAYCHEENITEYCDLLDYCAVNREDWFRVLCDNGTYVIKEYLKSKRFNNAC